MSAFVVSAVGASPTNAVPAAPLPTVDELLKRVVERSQKENANDLEFRARYHFTRSKSTEYRNSSGELKSRSVKTNVNGPEAAPVIPAVAQVNGKPSSKVANTNSPSFDKKDLLSDTNILSRFQFSIVGRETIAGRSALIVDFKPANKKLPDSSLKDRFLNKAAGRVWVDEAEAVLVKANVRLTDKITLLGGLVGALNKFSANFSRERTAEGIWYTKLATWHAEAREVIFNRIIDFEEKKTGVKAAW